MSIPLVASLLAALPLAAAGAPDEDGRLEKAHGRAAAGEALEHGKAATGDASTLDPGVVETEFVYAPVWNDTAGTLGFDDAPSAWSHVLRATVARGLVEDLDARISFAVAAVYDAGHLNDAGDSTPTGTGLADAVVGLRWRFLRLVERALELAVVSEAVIPVGSRDSASAMGVSQGFWSARAGLVATQDVGRFTLDAEASCAVPFGAAGAPVAVLAANAAVGYHLTPWLQPEVEVNYQVAVGAGSHAILATAGVVAPWGEGNRIVAAVQRGVWGYHAAQTTGLVLAYKTAL